MHHMVIKSSSYWQGIKQEVIKELGSIYFLDHGVKWSLTIKINKEII